MNNLYVQYYNHIFRKCSRTSPDDFQRLPGLKYDDLMVKIIICWTKKSNISNRPGPPGIDPSYQDSIMDCVNTPRKCM